ncbi:MAG: hypothetical protein ACR2KL_11400 [Nocardioidaceae bacterium]
MIELSSSRMHVAILLTRLQAIDHHPIVGRWPSLLMATDSASLQLDPAGGLTRAQAALISGRLLREVIRWDESIRRCDSGPSTMNVDLAAVRAGDRR